MSSTSPDKVRELTQLMTVPEILAALGGSVSRDTFYKWRQTGKGPQLLLPPEWGTAVHGGLFTAYETEVEIGVST